MLKLIKNPKKRPPPKVEFSAPFSNQKTGVELTICMNVNRLAVLTAPQCGIAQRILVTKQKPGTFFNPELVLENTVPESFTHASDDTIICLKYADYLGNESTCFLVDNDNSITDAVQRLTGKKKEKEIESHAN